MFAMVAISLNNYQIEFLTAGVGHARQPEDLRHGLHGPASDVLRPLDQVAHPSAQRLQRRVAF